MSGPIRPGLLVSVRSAAEAEAALEGGADLIDVKEPSRGSLGRADNEVIEEVIRVVAGRRPVSAAMGDWGLDDVLSPELSRYSEKDLAFQKWGFQGWRQVSGTTPYSWSDAGWDLFLDDLQTGIALVAYADHYRAAALQPDAVWGLARRAYCRGRAFVLDTFLKDGSTLLDWMPRRQITLLTKLCHQAGVRIALAGSLGPKEITALAHVKPDWFAVRGAACRGGREGTVEADNVRKLKALIQALPAY